ncbi:helix-turn-helix transcriptional regulator [Chitiniphilus eburneus]|nr:AraC family transcriptional regulator [Chitiniphilus eburneus]
MSASYQESFDIDPACRQQCIGGRVYHLRQHLPLTDHDIFFAGYSDIRRRFLVERVDAPFHIAVVCVAGSGELIDGERRLPLAPGMLGILPAGPARRGLHLTGEEWQLGWLLLDATPRWSRFAGPRASVAAAPGADSFFHALALFCHEVGHRVSGAGMALVTVLDLFQRMLAQSAPPDAHSPRLWALFDQVGQDPAREWRVEALAQAHGVSVEQLLRLCVRYLGATPQQLVIAQRMERARRLMVAGCERVGDVAAAVGYQEIASFSRRFQQHFGVNPSEMLRQLHATPRAMPLEPRVLPVR